MKLKNLDIVYVVKDSAFNEELRYSLRSVEKNFPHRKVVFYGGKPMGLHPDRQVVVNQKGECKYDRVRGLLEMIARDDEITEDFVLFNDDFFVMDKVNDLPYYMQGDLPELCVRIECKNNYRPTPYTTELKKTYAALRPKGFINNFELHVPIVFNRHLLKDVLKEFPDNRGTRSLYCNKLLGSEYTNKLLDSEYTKFEGMRHSWVAVFNDVKIWEKDETPENRALEIPFLSTSDESFVDGKVGRHIKDTFTKKSRWER